MYYFRMECALANSSGALFSLTPVFLVYETSVGSRAKRASLSNNKPTRTQNIQVLVLILALCSKVVLDNLLNFLWVQQFPYVLDSVLWRCENEIMYRGKSYVNYKVLYQPPKHHQIFLTQKNAQCERHPSNTDEGTIGCLESFKGRTRILSDIFSGFFLLQHAEFLCGSILEKWAQNIAVLAFLPLKMTTQEKHIFGPSVFVVGAVNLEGDTLLPINLCLRVHFF